jgi:predicted permease
VTGPGPLWSAAFRLAARLHPAWIRDGYLGEMEAAFRAGWRERRRRGPWPALAFAGRSVADALRSAARERRNGPDASQRTSRGGGGMGKGPRIGEWWADLRVAARALRRTPGFTATAILVLALGIGANAAIFTAVRATLLAPPPFPDPERLVLPSLTDSSNVRPGPARTFPWSYPKWQILRDTEDRPVDPVAAYAGRHLTLTGAGDAAMLAAELVTPDYLDVLGVHPLLGRDFGPGDDTEGAPLATILSHELWRERFGGDRAVVGRDVTLNGRSVTVLGVAPAGFRGLTGRSDLWVPVHTGATLVAPFLIRGAQAHWMTAVGRLPEGVTLEALRERMHAVGRTIEETYPDTDPTVVRGGDAQLLVEARINSQARRSLLVLSAAAALLLLVACANLAGLLLARASGRARETAVRVALGAGRWRVARGLLVESVLLAGLGGTAALLVAHLGSRWLVAAWPSRFLDGAWNVRFVDLATVRVDTSVLLFAAGVAVLAGLLFGSIPAWTALRTPTGQHLREGSAGGLGSSRRRWDLRGGLVAGEIALALVLLVGAGLLLRSLEHLRSVERGYRPGDVLVFDVNLPRTSRWAEEGGFEDLFLERLAALPDVESASLGCAPPLAGHCYITGVRGAGDRTWAEGSRPSIGVHFVSDGYFETLGVPVRGGRTFTSEDRAGSPPVAVLSEGAARELFPEGDALGSRIATGATSDEDPAAEVIGIVADVLYDRPENGMMAELYLSHRQAEGSGTYFLRTRGEPLRQVTPVRAALESVDADLPMSSVRTLEEVEARASSDSRVLGTLLTVFAGLALLLACTGVWAVVAFSVTRRTRELGLRMALGAESAQVVGLVMRRGVATALTGVVLGIGAAWIATRVLRGLLYEVAPSDPVSFVGGAAVLLAVAMAAAWLPARRATRVHPMEALRSD